MTQKSSVSVHVRLKRSLGEQWSPFGFAGEDEYFLLMLNKRPLRYEGEKRFSMVLIGHVEIERYKKRCRERRLPTI